MEQGTFAIPECSPPAPSEGPLSGGIYRITGPGGKVYIGSSDVIRRRWRDHRNLLRRNQHHNFLLQADWTACGEEAFTFEVIEDVPLVADLIDAEQWQLDAAKAIGPVYNIAADVRTPYRGLVHSDEAREKMSIAIRASMTPARLQEMAARVRGEANPSSKLDEGKVREICALLLMGAHPGEMAAELGLNEGTIYQIRRGQIWKHVVTPEMAVAMKAVRQNPWASGKRTVTAEHRERFAGVGRSNKGKTVSVESKRALSARFGGDGNNNAKLTAGDVEEIRQLAAAGARNIDLAERFGIHPNTVYRIKSGEIRPPQPT
jgi:DNA-binding CsgD family transcriptional regulator